MSTRAITAVVAALLIAIGARSAAQDAVWQVEPRVLPPPQAASRELRESIAVTADLNVYEGVAYADYLFVPDAPESLRVFSEMGEFLSRHLN